MPFHHFTAIKFKMDGILGVKKVSERAFRKFKSIFMSGIGMIDILKPRQILIVPFILGS
jgi:hypothetical protein